MDIWGSVIKIKNVTSLYFYFRFLITVDSAIQITNVSMLDLNYRQKYCNIFLLRSSDYINMNKHMHKIKK